MKQNKCRKRRPSSNEPNFPISFRPVTNEVPEQPVVSPASGAIFERRIIEKYILENGCDSITSKDITVDDLVVSFLSRFNIDHGQAHWMAVKRVLRYLKGTIDMQLTFRTDGNGEIIGFCDADYAGDTDGRGLKKRTTK